MIHLSNNLSKEVAEKLNKDTLTTDFEEKELSEITSLKISKDDISYLGYFENLSSLEIASFPSISSIDIDDISKVVPNIKSLVIKEQSALLHLDLSGFVSLESLSLLYNDNLVSIVGVKELKEFVFYDNKDFIDYQQIVVILKQNVHCHVTLDIVYYYPIFKCLSESGKDVGLLMNYQWVEAVGLRKHMVYEYSSDEVQELVNHLCAVVSKYVYVTDGEIEKFGILYKWMIQNIDFVNEDDPKGEDIHLVSNISKVFSYRKGGRLSFAKAFQLLLSFAQINSSVVYSLGALDTIGYYNGQKVYSLLGTSDYALLRITLDGRYYYCDIAWDSMVSGYKYFDELRLLLVSKDELKARHQFVGEGNITSSYSYHGDDSDDLVMFATDRLREVDALFDDIERYQEYILGKQMNCAFAKKDIEKIKNEMDLLDSQDDKYVALSKDLTLNENLLKEEEMELMKLKGKKNGIISSYADFLNAHYLMNDTKLDKSSLRELLEEKRKCCMLSDYMYEILSESVM